MVEHDGGSQVSYDDGYDSQHTLWRGARDAFQGIHSFSGHLGLLNADIAVAHGRGLWPTLIAIALSVTGLQLGFLGGLSTRYFIAASRTPGWRTARRPLHPVVPAE